MQQNNWAKYRNLYLTLLSLLIFLGLFIVITYPWISHFNTGVSALVTNFSADDSITYADIFQYLGKFRSISSDKILTELISSLPRGGLIISQLIFGEFTGYNIWWLTSFIVAFISAYLLVLYLTKNNHWAAFLGGTIFALFPYHFGQSYGHSGAIWYGWIGLLVLFILRYVRTNYWRDWLGIIISAALFSLSDHHYAAYAVLFVAILLIYLISTRQVKWSRKLLYQTLILAGVFSIGLVSVFGGHFSVYFSEDNWLVPPYEWVVKHSINIFEFISLPTYHILSGQTPLVADSNAAFGSFLDRLSYLGWIVVVIGLMGGYLIIKDKISRKKNAIWIITALLFTVFSWGAVLNFEDVILRSVRMPYHWLYDLVPFFSIIRATGRIVVVGMLGWAILATLAFDYFQKKYCHKRPWFKIISVILIIGFIALDFSYFNLPCQPPEKSVFYTEILARDPDSYAIMQIPASTNYSANSEMKYHNSFHNKTPINYMNTARTGQYKTALQQSTPVIRNLSYTIPFGYGPKIVKHDWNKIGPPVYDELDIKYIVLHKRYLPSETQAELIQLLKETGCRIFYEDDMVIVYQTSRQSDPLIFLSEDDRWSTVPEQELLKRNFFDITVNNSTDQETDITINMTIESLTYQKRAVEILYADDNTKSNILIDPFKEVTEKLIIKALPGQTRLKISFQNEYGKELVDKTYSGLRIKEIDYTY